MRPSWGLQTGRRISVPEEEEPEEPGAGTEGRFHVCSRSHLASRWEGSRPQPARRGGHTAHHAAGHRCFPEASFQCGAGTRHVHAGRGCACVCVCVWRVTAHMNVLSRLPDTLNLAAVKAFTRGNRQTGLLGSGFPAPAPGSCLSTPAGRHAAVRHEAA